ncbi:MAG: RHS repeat-associated core domain-containing protein [Bacteroidetes bacterium]|nr:RHS repeat-associated core domain-containing protein [Bacteroidota bacterium]
MVESWHRFYDPTTGRYISADPIGLKGGINLYTYALSNPIMYVDIKGLDVTICYYPEAAAGLGHVGIGLPEGGGGTVGFYPNENEDERPTGQIRPDLYTERECITIDSTCEEDECVRNCINQRAGNPGNYRLLWRQCTGFVRDCLRQCGLPSGLSNQPNPTMWFNISDFDRP